MRSKKLTALVLTTAVCASSLFGCGSDDNNTTTKNGDASSQTGGSDETQAPAVVEDDELSATITVAAPSEDQAEDNNWLKTQCEAFNAEHPKWDLKFEYKAIGEDQAGAVLKQDPAAGPDVYMYASDQIKTLVSANAIMPIIGDLATYIKDTNSEQIVENCTYDGQLYGAPYTANCWYMFYDKRKFSADDVKNLDTMLEKGKVDLEIGNAWYIEAFFLAAGCTIGSDADPKIDLGGDAGAKAGKYLVNLYANKNFSTNGGVAGLGTTIDAAFSGSWSIKDAKELLGENLGIAAKPEITFEDGTTGQLSGFASAKAIGINPNCKNQQVAVALVKFLTSEAAQKARYEARGVIPCNTALESDDSIKNDEAFIAQNAAYNQDMIQPFFVGDADYWTQSQNYGNAVIGGEVTADNAGAKADEMTKVMQDKLAEVLGN